MYSYPAVFVIKNVGSGLTNLFNFKSKTALVKQNKYGFESNSIKLFVINEVMSSIIGFLTDALRIVLIEVINLPIFTNFSLTISTFCVVVNNIVYFDIYSLAYSNKSATNVLSIKLTNSVFFLSHLFQKTPLYI